MYETELYPTPTGDIVGVIFSKDRAMQLETVLQSLSLHCRDLDHIRMKVLYHPSGDLHARQYQFLKNKYTTVEFIQEGSFKHDLLALLTRHDYVLFLVDDNIFTHDFSISRVVSSLKQNPDAIGFSLRLGLNTTYCYIQGKEQRLPTFARLGSGVLKYDWTRASYDFGYPLEVSSSTYRTSDMLLLLNLADYVNPNTLELALDKNKFQYRSTIPCLLCFECSVTFCNPANIVQTAWKNKVGGSVANSSQALADKFAEGYRIDITSYKDFTPTSCHQEVEFHFCRR